jgi:hypothetical protein
MRAWRGGSAHTNGGQERTRHTTTLDAWLLKLSAGWERSWPRTRRLIVADRRRGPWHGLRLTCAILFRSLLILACMRCVGRSRAVRADSRMTKSAHTKFHRLPTH